MASTARLTQALEIDSNEALHAAIVEGDFSHLSPEMRQQVDRWLQRVVSHAIASGPARSLDLATFNHEVRARYEANRKT